MKTDSLEESKTIRGGMRDLAANHHWRTLNKNFSLCDKPKKIIALSGNASISPRQSNALCKEAENLLAGNPAEYEICGFYYSNNDRQPKSVIQRADELLDYFVPLIARTNKWGDLQRLPTEQAAANMRNITVFTHCYGSRIINAVDNKLDEIMA